MAAKPCPRAARRPRRFPAWGILLAAVLFFPLGAAEAKVESRGGVARADRGPAAGSAVSDAGETETGGEPLVSPGPFRLACTQLGTRIVEGRRVDRIALPPSSLIGALSFRRGASDRGQTIVLPLGDGLTTCVLTQEPDYLRRAAAAVERAIALDRPTTWASAGSDAHGRVSPIRSFIEGGRSCREFTQTVTVGGRAETRTGIACRGEGGGAWRLVR